MLEKQKVHLSDLVEAAVRKSRFRRDQIAYIINFVDHFDRIVLTHQELVDVLGFLIQASRVRELKHLRFSVGTTNGRPFSGVSAQEYDEAVAKYRRRFS